MEWQIAKVPALALPHSLVRLYAVCDNRNLIQSAGLVSALVLLGLIPDITVSLKDSYELGRIQNESRMLGGCLVSLAYLQLIIESP